MIEDERPLSGQSSPTPADGLELRPKSRTQRKRDAHALTELGAKLVGHSDEELARLPLDDDLREAIVECRRLTKNARSRQLRRIGKLLRERDVSELSGHVERLTLSRRAQGVAERENERWRSRLLAEGNRALSEFLDAWPGTDPGQLRTLVRQALRTPEGARSVRARRELLRVIRAARSALKGSE